MQTNRITLLPGILATLMLNTAGAVQITSATISQTRVEGQSVPVYASVDWDTFTPGINQYVIRTVRATLLPPSDYPSVYPIEPRDALSGEGVGLNFVTPTRGPSRWEGAFVDLPSTRHRARITATQYVATVTYESYGPGGGPGGGLVRPTLNSIKQGEHYRDVDFVVLPSSECFNFDVVEKEWTVKGFFDDSSNTRLSTLQLSQASSGFLGSGGALRLRLPRALFASPEQFTGDGTWRVEIESPPLDKMPQWQDAIGVDLRVKYHWTDPSPDYEPDSLLPMLRIQPVLQGGTSGGAVIERFEQDAEGEAVVRSVPDWYYGDGSRYVLTMFQYPPRSGSKSVRLLVKLWGQIPDLGNPIATQSDPYIDIDGVCPAH